MQQYFEIKANFPDTLLFFQVGDFYELFFEDAEVAARFLGIALTKRGTHNDKPIPLCGVPLHAKHHYLQKLVKGGFKVALCDQLEEAKPGTLVKRGIAEVLTPGTLTDSQLLDEKSSSYLFSLYPGEHEWALVFGELLTAQLWATIIPAGSDRMVESELARFFPDELLIPDIKAAKPLHAFFKKQGYVTTIVEGSISGGSESLDRWIGQFPEPQQKACADHASLRLALYYFYAYLSKNQHKSLDQFNQLFLYQPEDFLQLDAATQRNLELARNSHDGSRVGTLLSVMDGAATPMGSRMIKKWIQRPLVKKEAIEQRLDVVAHFVADVMQLQMMQQLLAPLGDVERVIGRIVLGRGQPYDYEALRSCMQSLPALVSCLNSKKNLALLCVIAKHLDQFDSLATYLHNALADDVTSGTIIKTGFDKELDHMRDMINSSNEKLLALERYEQQETGIQSLKIRYNAIHGYYIEVTNPNKDLVPDRYQRRQTLVGKERYTTPELAQLAYDIERSRAHIADKEKQLFNSVKEHVASYASNLRRLAHALAHMDALHGIAKISYNNGYTRPSFTDTRDITIKAGRHPVIESLSDASFIPNDATMNDARSLWIITGPNMGGKSTFLRQNALICIMAQCGSYVPAQYAKLPLLDRIFTRIGAGDNLAAGKSTFLVEMEETASICMQATDRSLVILDEVGRGTSTFDGLAIAQAVIEYLYEQVRARCLFATHYHELTHLSDQKPGIISAYVLSKKTDAGIVFLYKIQEGVADGSFGVEVARLAGLPLQIIQRSEQLLGELSRYEAPHVAPARLVSDSTYELLTREKDRCARELTELKSRYALLEGAPLDDMTPRQAWDLLWRLKEKAV